MLALQQLFHPLPSAFNHSPDASKYVSDTWNTEGKAFIKAVFAGAAVSARQTENRIMAEPCFLYHIAETQCFVAFKFIQLAHMPQRRWQQDVFEYQRSFS